MRNKPKGKNMIKTKKQKQNQNQKMYKVNEVAKPRFELTPRLSPAGQVSCQTTGPRFPWSFFSQRKNRFRHFSLPFTPFEACGAVLIMNSKINWRKISLNEYFKVISHYSFQCLLFTFGLDARSSSSSLFWLKFISPLFIIIVKTFIQSQVFS